MSLVSLPPLKFVHLPVITDCTSVARTLYILQHVCVVATGGRSSDTTCSGVSQPGLGGWGSDPQSPNFDHGGLNSIKGKSMWDLWWTKYVTPVVLPVLQPSPVNTIQSILHNPSLSPTLCNLSNCQRRYILYILHFPSCYLRD